MPSSSIPSSPSSEANGSAPTAPSQVSARMTWRTTASAPEVQLSFQSTQQPEVLLAELRGLGWTIPRFPTPPSSAIEWVPDPVAGTDYTIHPWQVDDFNLGQGQWTDDIVPAIGALTFEALRRNGAEITGSPKMLAALAARSPQPATNAVGASQSAGNAPSQSVALGGGDHASGIPQVILVGYTGEPVAGFRHMDGLTGGRSKLSVLWSETAHDLQAVCSTEEARVELFNSCDQAWAVDHSVMPEGSGSSSICALLPDTSVDDKKLKKLAAALGDSLMIVPIRSLDQRSTGQAGVLLCGVIAQNAYDLLSSNLRMRFPKAVVRVENS